MQIGADFIEEKVDYQDDGGVAVDDKMMTSVDGIYAIGDIRNTPFKQARGKGLPHIPPTTASRPPHPAHPIAASPLSFASRPRPRPPLTRPNRNACDALDHQVVVAAADGCIAAMDIDRYLKNRKKVRVDWIHE